MIKFKLRYRNLPEDHIANVEIGDIIQTPIGKRRVYDCDEVKFTTYPYYENGGVFRDEYTKDNGAGYGNVGYFEGGNEKIFKILL